MNQANKMHSYFRMQILPSLQILVFFWSNTMHIDTGADILNPKIITDEWFIKLTDDCRLPERPEQLSVPLKPTLILTWQL